MNISLIERLKSARYDPVHGNSTAQNKNFIAFSALLLAQKLMMALVGWAIDHVAGLAAEGRPFILRTPHDQVENPEYLAQIEELDDHRHELAGANLRIQASRQALDPLVARKIMINLLRANPGAFPQQPTDMLVQALEALDYNEELPILRPRKAGRNIGFRQEQMRLKTIEFIAYRRARGKTKASALQEVADAMCVEVETVKSWERRMRNQLGDLAVDCAIANAKLMANEAGNQRAGLGPLIGDEVYGPPALAALAAAYKAVQRVG